MTMITQTVSLDPKQHAWLKAQPAGISGTIRLLTDEAMAKKARKPTKADLEAELLAMRAEVSAREARLRDETNARLEAEQRAHAAFEAAKTAEERERDRHERWAAYRDAHPEELKGLSMPELKALKDRVSGGGV